MTVERDTGQRNAGQGKAGQRDTGKGTGVWERYYCPLKRSVRGPQLEAWHGPVPIKSIGTGRGHEGDMGRMPVARRMGQRRWPGRIGGFMPPFEGHAIACRWGGVNPPSHRRVCGRAALRRTRFLPPAWQRRLVIRRGWGHSRYSQRR